MDWKKFRTQVESGLAIVKKDWQPENAEKEKILRLRTERLARADETEDSGKQCIDILQFTLSKEEYGLELNVIREVFPMKDLTPLPCTPGYIAGLFNVRGKIITILDIRELFDLKVTGLSERNNLILIEALGMEAGILTDAIAGISSIPVSEIQASLPTLTDKRREYSKGISRQQVVLLDIPKILSDERIIVEENV